MLNNRLLLIQRSKFLLITLSIFFLLITIRLFWLQIYKNDFYLERSKTNSERIEPLKPLRGLIFDRNDNVLAENILTYNLEVDIENKSKEDINKIINDKIAIYDLNVDKRSNKFGNGKKLENYEINSLPKYLQNNSEKYKEWID